MALPHSSRPGILPVMTGTFLPVMARRVRATYRGTRWKWCPRRARVAARTDHPLIKPEKRRDNGRAAKKRHSPF